MDWTCWKGTKVGMQPNRPLKKPAFVAAEVTRLKFPWKQSFVQPEFRSWGAHPPRVWLDAPRVQPLARVPDTELLKISMRPMFSARARKTAPEAGALPINFGGPVE